MSDIAFDTEKLKCNNITKLLQINNKIVIKILKFGYT